MHRPSQPRAVQLVKADTQASSPVESPASSEQPTVLQSMLEDLRSRPTTSRSMLSANLGSALESIWSNRTRAFLTVLGVIIGVGAVIGALTLTQSVGGYINNLLSSLGSNAIQIQSGAPSLPGAGEAIRASRGPVVANLTPRDLQTLKQLPHVIAISPSITTGAQVVYSNQNWKTSVIGASPDIQIIQGWDLAQGLWFTEAETSGGASVAVIGDTVAHHLFDASGVNPIGQKIRIGSQLFRVVGVTAPKGVGIGGANDNSIFIPYKTSMARFTNQTAFFNISLQTDSQENVNPLVQTITLTLEQNHRIARGAPDDFSIITSAQLLEQANQGTAAFTLLLTGIAAISLTVGGIGIMNIMLVSVTERTREIGIRMSIGAKRSDIRNQFLSEALFLSLLGAMLGLLIGLLIGLGITSLIPLLAGGSGGASSIDIPLVITPTTIILPFAIALAIGIIFGLYPAVRASRLDPIVALRKPR